MRRIVRPRQGRIRYAARMEDEMVLIEATNCESLLDGRV